MSSIAADSAGADPSPSAPTSLATGSAGEVLALIRAHGELTRAEIARIAALSRSTVAARLETLQQAGLIRAVEATTSTRGRPPTRFQLREDAGALLIADSGATGVRVAVTDLAGHILEWSRHRLDITLGPQKWLDQTEAHFAALLTRTGLAAEDVRGIGLALPGPVDSDAGTVVNPPIMTGWDRYPIRDWFAQTYTAPVIVENDANAMAVGEHRHSYPDRSSMLMVKLATGVGAGLIIGGTIYRGADGAAGDIGHIQVTLPDEGDPPQCRCGNIGCIEAYAGGWALVRDLRAAGLTVGSVPEVVALIASGDPTAARLARRAGRLIGIALSDAVSLLNPEVVVIGGELAAAENHLFAGIRESVYARSLPLATRRLSILPASQGELAGTNGLAASLTDHIYTPTRIDRQLAKSPVAAAE